MEALLTEPGSWLSMLGSLALIAAGHLAQKYVIPFLKVGRRQRYAEYIMTIAGEVIDDLQARYPNKDWLKHLDEATEKLAAICGVSTEVASRAVRAASTRT